MVLTSLKLAEADGVLGGVRAHVGGKRSVLLDVMLRMDSPFLLLGAAVGSIAVSLGLYGFSMATSGRRRSGPRTHKSRRAPTKREEAEGTTLRLAVLNCEDHGVYGRDVMRSLCELFDETLPDVSWRLFEYNAKQFQFPSDRDLEAVHGVIIPGSRSSAYEDEPWVAALLSFIRSRIHARRIKTLGLCFGHQAIAMALGGVVKKNSPGLRAGANEFRLMNGAECVLLLEDRGGRRDRPSRTNADTLRLLYHHGDVVDRLPPSARLLGVSDECPCDAAAYFDSSSSVAYMVTLQAHLEFETKVGKKCLKDILDSDAQKGISASYLEKCRESMELETDSVEATQAVVRYLWLDPPKPKHRFR